MYFQDEREKKRLNEVSCVEAKTLLPKRERRNDDRQ